MRVFFTVNFPQKEKAKQSGFRWSSENKSWYYDFSSREEFDNLPYYDYPPNREIGLNTDEINEIIKQKNMKEIQRIIFKKDITPNANTDFKDNKDYKFGKIIK